MQKKRSSWRKKKGFSLRHLNKLLLPLAITYADNGPLYSKAVAHSINQQEQTANQGATKAIDQTVAANSRSQPSGATSDVMIVDPKIISQDWADAFQALKTKKVANITFGLRDNTVISNVSNVEILSGGYLMLFSIKTIQGPKYQIVKTSDITSLSSK